MNRMRLDACTALHEFLLSHPTKQRPVILRLAAMIEPSDTEAVARVVRFVEAEAAWDAAEAVRDKSEAESPFDYLELVSEREMALRRELEDAEAIFMDTRPRTAAGIALAAIVYMMVIGFDERDDVGPVLRLIETDFADAFSLLVPRLDWCHA